MTRDEYIEHYGNYVTNRARIVITNEDGAVITSGDEITSSKGGKATLVRPTRFRSRELGKTGKVLVRWTDHKDGGEFYDNVFGIRVEMVE